MALFNFGKKKEEKGASCCCKNEIQASNSACCCASSKDEEKPSCACGEKENSALCIKVLGAGCKSCHDQYEFAKEAVNAMGLSADVQYITDMEKVMAYGVMSMPALVVNEQVVSMGKVLKAADVKKLLEKLGIS